MLQKKVKPNIFTYNLLLRSIRDCGLGDIDVAQDVFHRITGEYKIHECKVFKARPLLSAGNEDLVPQSRYSAWENITEEVSLHEVTTHVEDRPNLLAVRPHFGNIIALSEVKKPEDRLILVGGCSGLLEQMNKYGVKPDIRTFTQLLDTIPSTKSAEQALLLAMEKADVRPDIDFYNMLIKKRSMRFDYKNAHDVLKLIKSSNLYPDIVTFGVLALGCQTKQEAQCLLTDMRDAGFRMNAEILGAMLKQGCCHFNFEYILTIMETALQEEVRPNEKFLEHLENFLKECQKKIRNKGTELPQIHKTAGRNYFQKSFQKFCSRYTSWLEEIIPEKLGHPWEQFQKNYSQIRALKRRQMDPEMKQNEK
ncbi:hypothetical protein B7P43_G03468 [Cryptotermes secundus]|nr:hypothetical protein B7P43_G03468 [Cryptotermes secundus]